MEVKIELNSAEEAFSVESVDFHGERVSITVGGKSYRCNGYELISAVKRCMLNDFGR